MAPDRHIDMQWAQDDHPDNHDKVHTKERTPQFNESNISSNEAAAALAAGSACQLPTAPAPAYEQPRVWANRPLVQARMAELLGRLQLGNTPIQNSNEACSSPGPGVPGSQAMRDESESSPLTSESLQKHESLKTPSDACNVCVWLGGEGPVLPPTEPSDPKLTSRRVVAIPSSKPSVASSGCLDYVMVMTPNYVEEAIAAVGSHLDHDIPDPNITDLEVLVVAEGPDWDPALS